MVWQPNILIITAMSIREAMPPNHPPGALPLDPAGRPLFPRPPVPPPPNPGYATGYDEKDLQKRKVLSLE